jgi:single-strand DNA-binding protein
MRQLLVIGYLGKDATVTQHNGYNIINFSIADSEKYKNNEGVEITKTTWIECAIWKKVGDSVAVANYLKKGTQVMVQGTPDVSTYTNKDNQVVAKLTLRVSQTQLLGGNTNKPEPNAAAENTPETNAPEPSDPNKPKNLPF